VFLYTRFVFSLFLYLARKEEKKTCTIREEGKTALLAARWRNLFSLSLLFIFEMIQIKFFFMKN
jgi:hypothetical protein